MKTIERRIALKTKVYYKVRAEPSTDYTIKLQKNFKKEKEVINNAF